MDLIKELRVYSLNFERLSIFGNSNIGVYIYVNNKIAIVPPGVTSRVKKIIRETLEVDVIESTIAGSTIVGVFIAGNDKSILLPYIAKDEELDNIKESVGKSMRVEMLDSKNTALGNLIASNNKVALVSPVFNDRELKLIEEVLGVRVVRKKIINVVAVGSAIVMNDSVGLIHPSASDEEIEKLEKILEIKIAPATVNEGVGYVKVGLLLNNKGVIVGEATTGPEIMNIQSIIS